MSTRESAMNRLGDMPVMGLGPHTTAAPAGQYDPSAKEMCARERTAREVLETLCVETDNQAADLHALLKALPLELPFRADRALRRLIQK